MSGIISANVLWGKVRGRSGVSVQSGKTCIGSLWTFDTPVVDDLGVFFAVSNYCLTTVCFRKDFVKVVLCLFQIRAPPRHSRRLAPASLIRM